MFTRSPGTDIIKLGKEFALVDLLTYKLLCYYKVLKVIVVYKYSNQDSGALEFSSPWLKGADDSKKLFVVDFVIIFYRVKFMAYKSDRV